MVLKEGDNGDKIDLVFNTYMKNSIKNSERSLCSGEASHQLQHIIGARHTV